MPNPGLCVSVSESPPASKRARSRLGQRGFTLIELIVIIVVIAILAVIAMPRMLDFGMFNEVGFHDSVKASIQYARKLAVGSRRYVCVTVTTGSGGKVAIRQNTNAPESVGTPVVCNSDVSLPAASTVSGCTGVNEVCAPASVALGSDTLNIYFDPLGRPVDSSKNLLGLVTLTVTNQPDIKIRPNTGLVE